MFRRPTTVSTLLAALALAVSVSGQQVARRDALYQRLKVNLDRGAA